MLVIIVILWGLLGGVLGAIIRQYHRTAKFLRDLNNLRRYSLEYYRFQEGELRMANRKLTDRNMDLEYAINLECISMIESYQAENKLFSAIDDVRRSLTRILNTA